MEGIVVWLFIVVIGANLAAALLRLRKVEQRVAALALANKKLDFLLQNAGVEFDPYEGLPREVRDALRGCGNKIEAIAKYRKATNSGLKEAKDVIEAAIEKTGIDL